VSIKHIEKENIICWHWDSNKYSLLPRSIANMC